MSDTITQDVAIRGERNIVVGKGNVIITPLPPAETRLRHDLRILLKNVQTTWIKGVLEKSVQEAALLELGVELREEAVDNPWRMVIEGPGQPCETLPRGRKIKDIFDEANRLLLILGEPGSGKTTTLLQLARDLISEVDVAFTEPIPIVLNLSTWTDKHQPLDQWLVGELNSKYRLPKRDGQTWLRERRILPLLDGLDEVKVEIQAACVEKINELVKDYGLPGLVVCSRIKEYTNLSVRLAFYRAIYLQPLTFEQIDEYLNQAGDKLVSLRASLRSDDVLESLARSPLILNVMCLAYHNTSAESLSNPAKDSEEALHQQIFDTYIARMLNRKAHNGEYSHEESKKYLSWLAWNMRRHNEEVFLIERLQPSWLQTRRLQWLYVLASRLVIGIIFAFSVERTVAPLEIWWIIQMTVIGGLIVGFSVSFIDIFRFELFRDWIGKFSSLWWSGINVVIMTLIGGLIFGLINMEPGLYVGLSIGLIYATAFGLIFGSRGSKQTLENDIQTVDALHWSWTKVPKGGVIGGIFGLIIGITTAFINGSLPVSSGRALIYGLGFGVMGGVLAGLERKIIETKSTANQGIQLSARNTAFGGLIVGISFDLIIMFTVAMNQRLAGDLMSSPSSLVLEGLNWGFSFGLIAALWYGGADLIQHYMISLILVKQGYIPRNYARFLDYAVDHIFLQKVGDGYRFIHRFLLDHFVDIAEQS